MADYTSDEQKGNTGQSEANEKLSDIIRVLDAIPSSRNETVLDRMKQNALAKRDDEQAEQLVQYYQNSQPPPMKTDEEIAELFETSNYARREAFVDRMYNLERAIEIERKRARQGKFEERGLFAKDGRKITDERTALFGRLRDTGHIGAAIVEYFRTLQDMAEQSWVEREELKTQYRQRRSRNAKEE